ncbi:hypothetical protein [Yersinia similis]|uniref:hypothetical protein n=1 Tax=Yersinia similis TaxID=367190 RepID=UPI001643C562|nr:hypothetical protein [Yersinia similis]
MNINGFWVIEGISSSGQKEKKEKKEKKERKERLAVAAFTTHCQSFLFQQLIFQQITF